MVKVHINWEGTYGMKDVLKDPWGWLQGGWGFYMIFIDGDVVKIGQTYQQDFQRRLEQQLDHYWKELPTFKVGEIKWTTAERITSQLVNDVECLLIFKRQPRDNSKCKQTYTGREDLEILNTGDYSPLRRVYAGWQAV
jgi:hypothetical protein